jgi:hypothetical protein
MEKSAILAIRLDIFGTQSFRHAGTDVRLYFSFIGRLVYVPVLMHYES